MQPFGKISSRTVCHIKNEASCSTLLRKSKCWLIENCGPKSVLAKIGIFSPCLLRVSARRKI